MHSISVLRRISWTPDLLLIVLQFPPLLAFKLPVFSKDLTFSVFTYPHKIEFSQLKNCSCRCNLGYITPSDANAVWVILANASTPRSRIYKYQYCVSKMLHQKSAIAKRCSVYLHHFDFQSPQIIFHASNAGGLDFLGGYLLYSQAYRWFGQCWVCWSPGSFFLLLVAHIVTICNFIVRAHVLNYFFWLLFS